MTAGAAPLNIPHKGRVALLPPDSDPGLTELWWRQRSTQPCNWTRRTVYQNLVPLPRPGQSPVEIQIGIAAVTVGEQVGAGTDVGWTSHDFFVPPSLWGAGFGWYFLDGLLNGLSVQQSGDCYVVVKAVPQDAQHRIALDDHRAFIEQYRKIGFRQEDSATVLADQRANVALLNEMGFKEAEDTLFRMDLAVWSKRRGRSGGG
jgi:hypothetical protein